MDGSEIVVAILLGAGIGYIAYEAGKSKGNSVGYKRAQIQYSQWVRQVSADNAHLNAENARLSQENGSLRKENDIVGNLLRQQPTTPEAKAILKAVGRVELQLTQILPSALDNGEDYDTSLN